MTPYAATATGPAWDAAPVEPLLALRTGVRAALLADPLVGLYVAPDRIRTGWVRDDDTSAVTLRDGTTVYLGRAAGGQIVASLSLYLDVWAEGADAAQRLGGAVAMCLLDAPPVDGLELDDWTRPAFAWHRDPDPSRSMAHGAAQLAAVARWRAS